MINSSGPAHKIIIIIRRRSLSYRRQYCSDSGIDMLKLIINGPLGGGEGGRWKRERGLQVWPG